jgi:hypothetical protein
VRSHGRGRRFGKTWRQSVVRHGRSATTFPNWPENSKSETRSPDPDLLALARAFGENAGPWGERFVTQGLPENFLEDLAADIAAFKGAGERKALADNRRAAAGKTLDELTERGVKTVSRLDAIVRNVFGKNDRKLGEWKRARTVTPSPTQAPAVEAKRPEMLSPQGVEA